MAEFISYVSPGSYEIDFKTSDYSEYRKIEDAARGIIDKNTTEKDYNQNNKNFPYCIKILMNSLKIGKPIFKQSGQ